MAGDYNAFVGLDLHKETIQRRSRTLVGTARSA